jgi:hypothetical protein
MESHEIPWFQTTKPRLTLIYLLKMIAETIANCWLPKGILRPMNSHEIICLDGSTLW